MKPEEVTPQYLDSWLDSVPREGMNPTSNGSCVYSAPEGSHCLVGEFLDHLGVDTTKLRPTEAASAVAEELGMNPNVAAVLHYLQTRADMFTHGDNPEAWGTAIDATRDCYGLLLGRSKP